MTDNPNKKMGKGIAFVQAVLFGKDHTCGEYAMNQFRSWLGRIEMPGDISAISPTSSRLPRAEIVAWEGPCCSGCRQAGRFSALAVAAPASVAKGLHN